LRGDSIVEKKGRLRGLGEVMETGRMMRPVP